MIVHNHTTNKVLLDLTEKRDLIGVLRAIFSQIWHF